jgi:hypothetical protein
VYQSGSHSRRHSRGSPRAGLRSVLVGAPVTVRDVTIERTCGLKWSAYGPYPAVVLKEQRDAVAEGMARLGTNWDADIRAFDEVYRHILMVSDTLSLDEFSGY